MNIFGTDGIRGVANVELTPNTAFELGRAISSYLSPGGKLCIGKDTRISGDMLEASLIAGITSTGVDAIRLGVLTTPGLSFIVGNFGFDGGVMISASHNPFEYNGLKVFGPDGKKIPDSLECEVSEMVVGIKNAKPSAVGGQIGRVFDRFDLVKHYIEFLSSQPKRDMSNLRLLIDTANGSASYSAAAVWKPICPNVDFINSNPNGTNINDECGSTHMSILSEKVVQGGYHAGFAYDGDGDRCLAVDEQGKILTGDHIMAIMAVDMAEKGLLNGNTVVGTVMANLGLEIFLESKGISLLRSFVGDRFVLEEMDKGGYTLGGEQSGHIIFGHIFGSGDGMLTSLLLAEALAASGSKLSALSAVVKEVPQRLVNITAYDPKRVADLPCVKEAVEKATENLKGTGRVLVRPSGTEPVVRIMVECLEASLVEDSIGSLRIIIEKESLRLRDSQKRSR